MELSGRMSPGDKMGTAVIIAAACLILGMLTGCAGGMFGTGVGDGDVSDREAAVLNMGGSVYGVAGAGTKAQKVLGAPVKADVRQYPLLGEVTNHWDSKGTVTHPPYHYRIDPDFGSITGTYGVVKATAQATIDPALQAIIQQAIQDALQGMPASTPVAGPSAPATKPTTPATGPSALP